MCGPGQTPLPIMALDEFAGCSLCNTPAHNPNCRTPRHQPGALEVLAPRASLAAKDTFQVLPYVQLLKTRALHHGCPVEGLPHGPQIPCAFGPKKCFFPADSLLPALSTNAGVPPFALGFWHRPLWYNLQSMVQGSPPSCWPPFPC